MRRDTTKNAKGQDYNWSVRFVRSSSSLSDASLALEPAKKGQRKSEKALEPDRSIYLAHIEAIRKAKQFIYIENHFFPGSSKHWLEETDYQIHNDIPFEITRKIISKIEKHEKFTVFILIPMWPNDDQEPDSYATQEILHFQRETMQFMYHEIALAIKEVSKRAKIKNTTMKPTDYLNFFCLGKTIHKKWKKWTGNFQITTDGSGKKRKRRWRYPPYVHANLLIADDEQVIVSTANINERSMIGDRDTEAGITAYQTLSDDTIISN